jgi:YD repeat-containing protein
MYTRSIMPLAAGTLAALALVAGRTGSPTAPVVDYESVNALWTTRPDLCLTVALDAASAYECANLRVVHELPAINSGGAIRGPVLLYNSNHAEPTPVVSADVTLPAGATVPDSVVAVIAIGGVPHAHGKWSGAHWTPGSTRRISIAMLTLPGSGAVWDVTLEASNWYGGIQHLKTSNVRLSIADRRTSAFGAGWWLAGHEQLDVNWVTVTGGDGAIRSYVPADPGIFVARYADRADTLEYRPQELQFARKLRGGGEVVFDDSGRHVRTVDRLGQETKFDYVGATRLVSTITVPGETEPYRFQISNGRYTSITSPDGRITILNASGANLGGIQDPDGHTVQFGYAGRRMASRTDKRGTVTQYSYGAGHGRLVQAVTDPTGFQVGHAFTPAETRGYSSGAPGVPVLPDSAYTLYDGPRTDVLDHTRFWLDPFGAPARVRDALGAETQVLRQNATFPALVTTVIQPGGFTSTATHDARGRVESTTD